MNTFAPYRERLKGIVIESTFNWYWLKVFSPENAYGVEQAQVIKNTEGSNAAIVKGDMADIPPGS